MPPVSLPAIGCPPTKLTCSGSMSLAHPMTCAFVLVVSVTTAPSDRSGAICCITSRTESTGTAMITMLAPETGMRQVVLSAVYRSDLLRLVRGATIGVVPDDFQSG